MTAICPAGGPSGPKDWVSPIFVVPATALANYIGNAGGIWASLLAAAIGVKTVDVATSCGTDPPGWPAAFTIAEILTIQNHDFFSPDYASALQKLNQYADNVLWYVLCECKTGSTPAQPQFPSPPAGIPSNAPVGSAPSSRLCWTGTLPVVFDGLPGTGDGSLDISNSVLPYLGHRSDDIYTGTQHSVSYGAPVPFPSAMRCILYSPSWTAGQYAAVWLGTATVWGTSPTLSRQDGLLPNVQVLDSGIVPVSAATRWAVTAGIDSRTGQPASQATICIETYGSTTPGGCCPPDATSADIQQQLLALTKLLQKQLVPVAYAIGTPHTGLSGSGSIGLVGQVKGVIVTVTSSSTAQGIEAGNPNTLFEVGWINWASPDFYTSREWINVSPMFSSPNEVGLFTRIGYSLKPGVVIEITELV